MAARTAPLTLRSVEIRAHIEAVGPTSRLPLNRRARRPELRRRWFATVSVLLACLSILVNASPAAADPGEDRIDKLFEELEQAQVAYLDAKTRLDASVARQQQLIETLQTADAKMAGYQEAIGQIAARQYVAAGYTALSGILSAGSPRKFLDVLGIVDALETHQTEQVKALVNAVAEANALQSSIDAEIAAQQAALKEMDARKQQAEDALWKVGSGAQAPDLGAGASVVAASAPRSADGGWAPQTRTVWESETQNYITPRTAHARDEAVKAGFTKGSECYYGGGDGQHPLGRACDFAVDACHFCGDVYGADKQYGTDLAAFFVFNAQRLGVLYVIWYRQIWLPSSGWRSYSGCCTASQKHTNHVHLSVY